MLQNNTSLPYHQTLPAYLISRQFIKSMGHLLDWSSVVKDESVVYNAIIKPDASLSVQADYLVNATRSIHTVTIHTIITEYQCLHQENVLQNDETFIYPTTIFFLSLLSHRSQPFLFKDESQGRPICTLIAPSAKQHVLMAHSSNTTFPTPTTEPTYLCKKVKGLPRSRHNQITIEDFLHVAVRGAAPRKVSTARLQRSHYKMYLTTSSKKCLSRLSTKRLFYSCFKSQHSYFSFPLSWRHKLTS